MTGAIPHPDVCICVRMRFRVFYLLVLASLLGTPVLLHRNTVLQQCAQLPDAAMCATVAPDPFWVRPAGLLSLLALGAAAYLAAVGWTARHREKEMLDGVGVHVREEDLPLEE